MKGRVGGSHIERPVPGFLHLHPLPVGGCVNNMATGKINCGQAAGLRGVFVGAKGALGGKGL